MWWFVSSLLVHQLVLVHHNFHVSRYREQSCFVHRFEVATIQCMSCVTLKIPIKESYYCSTKCFLDTWKSHRMRHQVAESVSKTSNADDQASGILRSCGSWPCAGSWSAFGNGSLLDGTAMVVEREGKSWIMVGSSNTYFPSIDDYGFRLRLESAAIDCTKGSLLAPINIIVTDLVVVTPILRPRCMIQIGLPKEYRKFNFDARPSVAGSFSVLSYNVLSDIYANTGNHSYCPKWALTWEYRRQNLLYEITGYEADILCLQEVQNDHFENFFEPELVKRGYSVIYKKRNKEVFTISGGTIDGCATCFRHDRFKEIIKYELEFERNAASMVKTLQRRQNSNDDFRLMKDNVAIVVVLERKTSGAFSDALHSRICVANTHIHANKDLPDVKLWQVTTLINGLESIVQSDIPLLICGDLNSVPGRSVFSCY
ncbi:hypothetical protein HHK36_030673 [Tetracentron sinense]|uniref:Endonuclease/exonuclease/phosphatase domain-containing protein n=1 Tax=Tetracentron sinense TaxID=13715 RepID=A0A834Y9R2_TETSI|nr:hypothetical protein HHK36_030673 [Tetracentron sinense]